MACAVADGGSGAEVQRVRFAHAHLPAAAFLTQELRHAAKQAEDAGEAARAAHTKLRAQAAELKLCRKRLRSVQGDLQVWPPASTQHGRGSPRTCLQHHACAAVRLTRPLPLSSLDCWDLLC